MRIEFEENNSQEITPTKKATPDTIKHDGRVYTYAGKTKDDPAAATRVKSFFECFFMVLAGCLVIPCFFKGFRKAFKYAGSELLSGQEIVKHYVLNTGVFSEKSPVPKVPTDEELFQKGLEDSKKATFDG